MKNKQNLEKEKRNYATDELSPSLGQGYELNGVSSSKFKQGQSRQLLYLSSTFRLSRQLNPIYPLFFKLLSLRPFSLHNPIPLNSLSEALEIDCPKLGFILEFVGRNSLMLPLILRIL